MLRQGKKTAEELNTEFLQIIGQAGMDRKTPSDHLHLIGYYRKALEPRLSRKILFSDDVPKTMDGPSNLTGTGEWVACSFVTTLNNVSESSLYSHMVLSETLLLTVVVQVQKRSQRSGQVRVR
jgi:hypothetical protein